MDSNVYSTVTCEPSISVLTTPVCNLRTCDLCLRVESILADVDLAIGLTEGGGRNVFDGCLVHRALHYPRAAWDGGFGTRRFLGFRGGGYGCIVANLFLVAVDELGGRWFTLV